MKNITKTIMAVAIVVAVSFAANAQPGSTGSTGGFDDEPQDVPVDGGIIMLAAAGVAYGYRQFKKK